MSSGTGRRKPSPEPSCEPARLDVTTATPFQVTSLPLICLTQMHCHLYQLRPSALFFSCLHIPFTLKNLTEETFWKIPNPLCVPWLSCPESQTTILIGTLVVSLCHDTPGHQLSGKPTHAIPEGENRKKASPACRDSEAVSGCHPRPAKCL